MAQDITYEHPLNERTRLLLRLAHLFDEFAVFQPRLEKIDSRAAVNVLIDISSILSRSDIKSEIIKELERHISKLTKISKLAGVDTERLGAILDELETNLVALHKAPGQLGQDLKDHEFLKAIMQRSSIPGGSCDFDMPIYNLWLQSNPERRSQQLADWFAPLLPLRHSVSLLINLIRTSSHPQQVVAEQGFYQQSLDTQAPVQMLRVTVPVELGYIAEISGGKHRFSIRFLHLNDLASRPTQITNSVAFQLTKCVL